MSTSCTSAALAATTSGSNSLARNTSGATCAATLYASIDLHSDDADVGSGEEANVDKDKMTPVLPVSMPMMSASTRRNKRKNFQPRNIRPSDSPDGDDDQDNNEMELTTNQTEDGADGHPPTRAVVGEADVTSISSRRCDLKSQHEDRGEKGILLKETSSDRGGDVTSSRSTDKLGHRLTDGYSQDLAGTNSSSQSSQSASHSDLHSCREGSRDSSRSTSRSSSRGSSSRCAKSAAVDLRLRPASNNTEEDDQEDDANGQMSGLQMKTWMLFWQQQQSCVDGAKPPFIAPCDSHERLGREDANSQVEPNASTRRADEKANATHDYAEVAMRELLGIYRLQRHADAGQSSNVRASSPIGRSAAEGQTRPVDSVGIGSLRTSLTSCQQQPPTPPHTPKTSTTTSGQTALPLGRTSDFNEPSLRALQTHIQSILSHVTSSTSRQPSPSKQLTNCDDSPSGADVRPRSTNHQDGVTYPLKAASFANIDLHVDVDDDVTGQTKGFYDQHELQQLAPTNLADGRRNAASASSGNGTGSSGSGKSSAPIDYSRYVKRFGSAAECGSPYCKDLNYREHFHCLDCHPRVFVKKEEMIRHFKWHKKRDESLQHGFMRYSPGDDCNDRYRGCPHNRKQTHYHCVKDTCDKVYISTSDVQMHANYHRKDSAIIQEGFQRFRATEDCATAHCAFNGQRTTHFHCRRPPCNYTFKNKADMEKHKSYHIKDEQLARDGFKKFMKNEACQFDNCRFSRVCNHIHCIREGCTYVLHSSGQLYSHKRKHERRDAELAYHGAGGGNMAAIANTDSTGSNSNPLTTFPSTSASPALPGLPAGPAGTDEAHRGPLGLSTSDLSRLISDPSVAAFLYGRMPSLLNQLEMAHLQHRQRADQEQRMLAAAAEAKLHQLRNSMSIGGRPDRSPSPVMTEDDAFRLCLAKVETGKPCQPDCQIYPNEHYHCRSDGCSLSFKSTEAAKEHWRNHEQQEQISDNYYISVEENEQPNPCPSSCPYQTSKRHYHCCWDGCAEIILSTENAFRRLDHYKMHEYSRRGHQPAVVAPPVAALSGLGHPSGSSGSKEITFTTGSSTSTSFSLDSMFRRKRGRPPKNRVIEVWNEPSSMNSGSGAPDTPQAVFTSFKLPKPSTPPLVPYSSVGSSSSHFAPPLYGISGPSHSASSSRSNSSEWKSQRTLSPSPERSEARHSTRKGQSAADKCALLLKRNSSPAGSSPALQHPPPAPLRSPESPVKSITVVKAAGTFYPSSAFPTKNEELGPRLMNSSLTPRPLSPVNLRSTGASSSGHRELSSSSPTPITTQSSSLSTRSSSLSPSSSSSVSPSPSANHSAAATTSPPTPAILTEKPQAYGPDHSCGRPFCKLKRREHYHCAVCNQAFSEIDKLKPHVLKHCTGALSPTLNQWSGNSGPGPLPTDVASIGAGASDRVNQTANCKDMDAKKEELSRMALFNNATGLGTSSLPQSEAELRDLASRSSAALHALSFMSPMGGPFGLGSPSQLTGNPSSFHSPGMHQTIYAGSGLMLNNPMGTTAAFNRPMSPGKTASQGHKRPSSSPIDHSMLSPEAKKMRFPSNMRLLKDEPVPDGYVRFRFNEDCQYSQCGYREHQTHFHCMRPDCGYSFCDKTRFVQHTARHERLDTLMGGDFQQYRANVGCGRTGCLYTASLGTVQNKASHFHCLKCDFVCTDTNKVVAHRRQHQKTDSILAAGFEKFTPSQNCRVDSCPHSNKQTHYHCLKCCYAVLGLAQMSAHKYRHLESASS
ncbi:zinc finger protein castor homolog 1-like isoform X2 [Daphnia carinata]|uniref:zinc finger protein castor homolog 1-like isoform X2 n=1 Tax=Daphnia carinata TaxID=120202 RepID=UPI0028686E66|nr:zinc finger protein castor homolog 1-like isoform X2 [Daphnia carinata]